MNRAIKDEAENDPVDLKIEDPEDEELAKQDEALVAALQAEKKKSGQSTSSGPKPEVQTPPRRPRSRGGGMAGTPVVAELAEHPPAQPQEQVVVAEPTPPSMPSQPSPVEPPMQATRPRRHRDRTLKVTSSES